MLGSPHLFTETETLGRSTLEWALHGVECPALLTYGISALGYTKAKHGYLVSRAKPSFSNINITISGKGEAFMDRKWQLIGEGALILSPQDVSHCARVPLGSCWEFCWICFAETARRLTVAVPTLAQVDPKSLSWAILSLQQEFRHAAQANIIHALVQLIDLHIQRIISAWNVGTPLWKLWEMVAQHPEKHWTTGLLAKEVHMSERQLLRHCQKELGRSLQEQIIHIRMSRASSLLQFKDMKLQMIAESVGYQDAFSFSKTFKHWSGMSPRDYRIHCQ